MSPHIRNAISCANLVIIPVQPSPLDLWACSELVSQIHQRQALTDGVPTAAFQITRAKKGTQLARQIQDVIQEYDLPVLRGAIHDRTDFARSLSDGSTTLETDPDGLGSWEIQHMSKQIREAFEC